MTAVSLTSFPNEFHRPDEAVNGHFGCTPIDFDNSCILPDYPMNEESYEYNLTAPSSGSDSLNENSASKRGIVDLVSGQLDCAMGGGQDNEDTYNFRSNPPVPHGGSIRCPVDVQCETTSRVAILAQHSGVSRKQRNRSPPNNAISKLHLTALTKIVQGHTGRQPFKATADMLRVARHAAAGLEHLDDVAIRRLLLQCKRRLGETLTNDGARANKLALSAPQTDQVLRLLGRIRDDHEEHRERPNADKDWRAILAGSAAFLPDGFAARPRAGRTLAGMYSDLLNGKNKSYAVRAALTADQLNAAFAALSDAAAAGGRAVRTDLALAALALPALPDDIQARLSKAAETALDGAATLAREWRQRGRAPAAAAPPPPPSPALSFPPPPATPFPPSPWGAGWPAAAVGTACGWAVDAGPGSESPEEPPSLLLSPTAGLCSGWDDGPDAGGSSRAGEGGVFWELA